MPEMRPVFSSHIDAIGYDGDTSELHVTYQGGRTAIYEGVPPDKAAAVGAIGGTPPSIGEALHAHIRGKYKHRYA
jgi:KTSC domain